MQRKLYTDAERKDATKATNTRWIEEKGMTKKRQTQYSGIGGQAVLEGVMMKNKSKYAVAVRKPDGDIDVQVEEYKGVCGEKSLQNFH